jgi:hypothetical protein
MRYQGPCAMWRLLELRLMEFSRWPCCQAARWPPPLARQYCSGTIVRRPPGLLPAKRAAPIREDTERPRCAFRRPADEADNALWDAAAGSADSAVDFTAPGPTPPSPLIKRPVGRYLSLFTEDEVVETFVRGSGSGARSCASSVPPIEYRIRPRVYLLAGACGYCDGRRRKQDLRVG